MKAYRFFLVAALVLLPTSLLAQNLPPVEPGPRLIDGDLINQITTRVNNGPTVVVYAPSGTPSATDVAFFVATRAYRVIAISEVHSVAAGGASVIQVTKDTGTTAPGAGTDLLTNNTGGGFDLNATANTVQVGALATLNATITLAAGDRLSVDYAQTIQSTAGIVITVALQPM